MYRAVWSKNETIIAIDEMADLQALQQFVLSAFSGYRACSKADRVSVCDDRTTYFSLERSATPRILPSNGPRKAKFTPGMKVTLVANDMYEADARLVWEDTMIA